MEKRDFDALRLWIKNSRQIGDIVEGWDFGYLSALDDLSRHLNEMEKHKIETDKTHSLLGKRVRVTLEEARNECPPIIVTGKFLGFGEGGDIEIEEDDGFIHWCWPMLNVEEVKEND